MHNSKNLIGVKKIELMFAEDINYFNAKKEDDKKSFLKKT